MFTAMTEANEYVDSRDRPRGELRTLRQQHQFKCGECQSPVILKIGNKIRPHFSHEKNNACRQSYGEGAFHMNGKLQLYQWLKKQSNHVELEKYLPDIRQIPDIYMSLQSKKMAIEFQCAKVPGEIIKARTKGYLSQGIWPIWILGASLFKRKGHQRFIISAYLKNFIHFFSKGMTDILIFYCSETRQFIILSQLIMVSETHCLADIQFTKLNETKFPQLFNTPQQRKLPNLLEFLKIKSQFRLKRHHLSWQNYLYEHGLNVSLLSSLVFLPTKYSYLAKQAPWIWQTNFLIEQLMPLKIKQIFTVEEALRTSEHLFYAHEDLPLIQYKAHPLIEYINLLVKLGYLHKLNEASYQKLKNIKSYEIVDQAVSADREMIKLLQHYNQWN